VSTEVLGQWWLPGPDAEVVPGVLTIADDGRAELALIGSLRNPFGFRVARAASEHALDDEDGEYPRVLGRDATKAYTLEFCRRSSLNSAGLGEHARERITVGRTYIGAWFGEGQIEFDELRVSITHLDHWVQESGISEEHEVKEGRWSRFTVSVESQGKRFCRPWTGTTVALLHGIGTGGDGQAQRHVTQRWTFAIRTRNAIGVDDLLGTAASLRALVAVGTCRRATFEETSALHPHLKRPNASGRSALVSVDIKAPWLYRADDVRAPRGAFDLAFTLAELGGLKGVSHWLRVARTHQDAVNRAMASQLSVGMFTSDRMLHAANALEVWDRYHRPPKRNAPRITLAQRLRSAVTTAGYPFDEMVSQTDLWIKRVVKERNYGAHTLGVSSDGGEQYMIARSCYWLFVLCMLREAGAPRSVFRHIVACPDFVWVAERMSAMGY
jgi:hypothetical protein